MRYEAQPSVVGPPALSVGAGSKTPSVHNDARRPCHVVSVGWRTLEVGLRGGKILGEIFRGQGSAWTYEETTEG